MKKKANKKLNHITTTILTIPNQMTGGFGGNKGGGKGRH